MNNQATLVGLYKQVYGKGFVDAWAFMAKLTKRIAFASDHERNGDNYNVPVDLQLEHGISASAAGVTSSGTATSTTAATTTQFIDPTPGQSQNATVAPAQMVGRSQITYEAIKRSMENAAAFEKATKRVIKRLSQAMLKRVEIQILHGQRGIGIVESVSVASNVNTITITPGSWSPGIWAGLKGASVDVYQTNLTSKRNVTTLTQKNVIVTSITPSTRTVVLTGANAGDINTIAAGDFIFPETQSSVSEFAGMDVISRNTGTLFGINAATYELFGGNIYNTATGNPSFSKLMEAASLTASYGNASGLCYAVSPKAYEVLNVDQAALRVYGAQEVAKNGFKGIEFMGQVGVIEIMPHLFQKDGLIHGFVPDEFERVGSTDVTFIKRGGNGGDEEVLIMESTTSPASEMRCYSGQALFTGSPRHTVLLDGITYS